MTKKECFLELATAFIVLVSLVGMYWYFIDGEYINKPITYQENYLQPTKDTYTKGEVLFVDWKFCKHTNAVATIDTNMVDGIIWYLPPIEGSRPPGCYDKVDVIGEIPQAIPAGTYHLEITVSYRVNPIKVKTYHITTNKFKVIDK